MTHEPPAAPEPDNTPDPLTGGSQDSFRRVYFGQVAEPLVRPHPEPAEAEEDELTRAALGDLEAGLDPGREEPTVWRLVLIALLAALALSIVFGRH